MGGPEAGAPLCDCDGPHARHAADVNGEIPMAWTTPKITEIPLGAEINSYVCGQKKQG